MTDQFFTPTPSNDYCHCPTAYSKFTNYGKNSLVATIHVGQSSCVFTVYTAPDLKYLLSAQEAFRTYSPKPGWYEHDAEEIIEAVYKCSYRGCKLLPTHGHMRADIEAVGITNQRETLVVWDARTGEPLYKAIAPNDTRATELAEKTISKLPRKDLNHFKSLTGLPVLPYFPALKIRWLQENVTAVRTAIESGYCRVGTLDTWVIWKLTRGLLHVTDVTNASRTLLMNISTLTWDRELLKAFAVNEEILPEIHSCAEDFGKITTALCVLGGLRIGGIIGDQQAAMLGQMCLHKGQTIANFNGTCSLLCNTGKKLVQTKELFTSVAFKMGATCQCFYALEGHVPYCGNSLEWLQNNVRILPNIEDAESYADSVDTTDDVFFVPALSGLHAPYWRKDARGIFIGLSDNTTRSHIVRATFEAICFQTYDIVQAVKKSGEFCQNVIYAGGEYATNSLLMQMLADITGATVVHYSGIDSISYGAAMCAGCAMNVINIHHFEHGIWRSSIDFETFVPLKRNEQRMLRYVKWRRAVARSLSWIPVRKQTSLMGKRKKFWLFGSLFSGVLIAALIMILKRSRGSKVWL